MLLERLHRVNPETNMGCALKRIAGIPLGKYNGLAQRLFDLGLSRASRRMLCD